MRLYDGLHLEELFAHLRDAAKSAIFVQDACNLSGVVHDFSRVMGLLSAISDRLNKGTEWKNHHPIAVLYASKIGSLTGADGVHVFNKAYEACKKLEKNSGELTDTIGWE